MIALTLPGITNLNNSLQVGDMVYAVSSIRQTGAEDFQDNTLAGTGNNAMVGILRRITTLGNVVVLDVDDTTTSYIPVRGDFIMFSKYSQTDGDVNGYYAQATFSNNSKVKAELFSVGSEIIINSK